MMTAQQAYEIAMPLSAKAKIVVKQVIDEIAIAAKRGELKIRLTTDFFVSEGYSRSPLWLEVATQLEALGYEVDFYYSEGSFAVDMYTTVSWEKAGEA